MGLDVCGYGIVRALGREGPGSRHSRIIKGGGSAGKTIVMGFLKRGPKGTSRVHVDLTKSTKKGEMNKRVRAAVVEASNVYTDSLKSYKELREHYAYGVVDHAVEYVKGKVHTNNLENFWCLLKRGLKGTCVSVDPFHLLRYLDEQAYRFNNRIGKDGDRFVDVCRSIFGKRMDWNSLVGRRNAAITA